MTPLLVPLPGNEVLARALSQQTSWPIGDLETRKFPDEETYLRLRSAEIHDCVVLVCTLDRPDPKLLPLLFAAGTARELGAKHVGIVAPYLAYMRQDRRFKDGEAITSKIFADLLSSHFDWMISIDPHLHRYRSLDELYGIPTRVVHAASALSSWIAANVERPLIVGPDEESSQWVAAVAKQAGVPHMVLTKIRRGDRDVEVSVPHLERYRDRTPVIVDDIVSSARTMIETTRHIIDLGLRPPVCVGVHAIFGGDSISALRASGAARIATTNSVRHPTNAIEIAGLLAPALRELA